MSPTLRFVSIEGRPYSGLPAFTSHYARAISRFTNREWLIFFLKKDHLFMSMATFHSVHTGVRVRSRPHARTLWRKRPWART